MILLNQDFFSKLYILYAICHKLSSKTGEILPIKFKPSATKIDRKTKKTSIEHYYMKTTPKQELIDYLNSSSAKPKIKQKVRNELTRRVIKIVYTTQT